MELPPTIHWSYFNSLKYICLSSFFLLAMCDWTCYRCPLYSQPLPLHVNAKPSFLFLLLLFPAFPRHHTPLPVTLGSSCQMRTLDSGIGTFPLPDSVTRASGRHIPKSESSPDWMPSGSSELDRGTPSSHLDPSQPNVKVPSLPKTRLHAPTSMGHSLSDPTVTCSNNVQDTQSRLPKLATSGKWRTSSYSGFPWICANW